MTTDSSNRSGNSGGSEDSGLPPQNTNRFGLAFAAVAIILALVAIVVYNGRDTGRTTLSVPLAKRDRVTARDISDELTRFLKSLRQGDNFYLSIECQQKGACEPTGENLLQTAAWQILGAAGMAKLGKRDEAREHLDFYLGRWTDKADLATEFFSIHQLYYAYLATGKPDLLGWFSGRLHSYLAQLESTWSRGETGPFEDSFLTATASRQFAQGAAALKNPEQLKFLVDQKQFPGGDAEVQRHLAGFLDVSRRLIDRAETLLPATSAELLIDGTGIELFRCWIPWARLSLYDATGNAADLEPVLTFLQQAHFSSRDPAQVNASPLQAILPCLEVLIRLRNRSEQFQRDYRYLMENFLLKSWDSRQDPVCNGDGGFFAVVKDTRLCEINTKDASDNSWILYLLSHIADESFEIKARPSSDEG